MTGTIVFKDGSSLTFNNVMKYATNKVLLMIYFENSESGYTLENILSFEFKNEQ